MLDRVSFGSNIKKFICVRMLKWKIGCKCPSSNRSLTYYVDKWIKHLHKVNGSGRVSIILYLSSTRPQISKKSCRSSSILGHHPNFGMCMKNTSHIITDIRPETWNRKSSILTKVCPHWTWKRVIPLFHISIKLVSKSCFPEKCFCSFCYIHNSFFSTLVWQKISSLEECLTIFI